MRDLRSQGWALAFALVLVGACGGGETRECDPDQEPRSHCESETVVVGCDPLGSIETWSCSEGWVCIESTPGETSRASCIPEDSEVCDKEAWTPTCAGERGWLDCEGSGLPAYTKLQECDSGEICLDVPQGPVCVREGTSSCDPDEFEAQCVDDARTSCKEGGYTWVDEDCAADGLTCKMQGGEPWCADRDATPCDPGEFRYAECLEGHVRECDGDSSLTSIVEECDPNEICLVDECYSKDLPSCDDDSIAYICGSDDTQSLFCRPELGIYVPSECPQGEVCRELLTGEGTCIDEDAEPCDPKTYEPRCSDETTRIICAAGYTFEEPCVDAVCKTSDLGGFCVPPEAEPCNPATYQSSCIGDTADYCNFFDHFTHQQECAGSVMCVADQDFLGLSVAMCLLDDAPPCVDVADTYCSLFTRVWCIGGYAERDDCSLYGELCVNTGQFAECVPDDLSECDPETFQQDCDGNVFVHCQGSGQVRTHCSQYGRICDPVEGCVLP